MADIPNNARWYLADIVLEHTIEADPCNLVHVNIHLIQADSPDQAYEKALLLGRSAQREYINTAGRNVRVTFRGLRDLNVIHDALEDGAELAYEESIAVPETKLTAHLRPKEKLAIFENRIPKTDGPNYMPQSVMRLLKEAGLTDTDITNHA